MNWEEYRTRFAEEAARQGRPQSFVDECLAYAKPLIDAGLPVIYDLPQLASEVGATEQELNELLEHLGGAYVRYRIPKHRGGYRLICEPKPPLRHIQQWILRKILDRRAPHDAAKAFCRGRSIKQNAESHVGQRLVLSLDIRNFFGSVRSEQVIKVFLDMGYSSVVAHALSELTMLRGRLPQGAPTSPALSNLVMVRVDRILSRFVSRMSIRYTRYADDLTFSGSFRVTPVLTKVRAVLRRIHLHLNSRKTRLMCRHQRQEVTGVVANVKMQAPRELRRRLRQEIYYLKKFGETGHVPQSNPLHGNRIDHLRGVAEFVRFLNPDDRDAHAAIEFLGRYRPSKDKV